MQSDWSIKKRQINECGLGMKNYMLMVLHRSLRSCDYVRELDGIKMLHTV